MDVKRALKYLKCQKQLFTIIKINSINKEKTIKKVNIIKCCYTNSNT